MLTVVEVNTSVRRAGVIQLNIVVTKCEYVDF